MDGTTDGGAAGAADPTLIDWARVAALRDEIGEDSFAEVAALFLDEVEQVLARLAGAGGMDANAAALADDMHFLKGSAWNLGFARFADFCARGEALAARAGLSGKRVGAALDLASGIACFAASRRALLSGPLAGAAQVRSGIPPASRPR